MKIQTGVFSHFPSIILLSFSLLFSVKCMGGQPSVPVFRINEDANIPIFRIAFTSDLIAGVDQEDAKLALNLMIERLAANHLVDYRTEAIIFPDVESAVQEFKNGNINLISLSTINYLKYRKQIEMMPAFVASSDSMPEHDFVFLVKRSQNIKSLINLKDKMVIVEKGYIGNTALVWLDTILFEGALEKSASFFNKIKRVDKSSQAILPVFFGQADACVVLRSSFDTMVELNPQVDKILLVFLKSPPLLLSISCFTKGVDEKLKTDVVEWDYSSATDLPAKQFSLMFHFEQIITYKPEYLHNIESLYNRHQSAQKK